MEAECSWKSTQKHLVNRIGFTLSHAFYLTAAASQGQTLRKGITIDCARIEGANAMNDDSWWLNLYVMFSRATQMSDLLLLRPPARQFLERGPPDTVKKQLAIFEKHIATITKRAEAMARRWGFDAVSYTHLTLPTKRIV